MVLLVVDTQKAITTSELYEFELFKSNVKQLIDTARKNNIEVIFIRHDDGADSELTKGKDGFEIYDEFQPLPNELIFDKNVNSAFKDTGLTKHLKRSRVSTVVVVGLQTDYCIDATVKAGFELNFKMIVPAYANSTFNNPYMTAEQTYKYYNEYMWNERYAKCFSVQKTIDLMKNYSHSAG